MIRKTWSIVIANGLLLIAGAACALLWANFDWHAYEKFIHFEFTFLQNDWVGVAHDGHRVINLHYIIVDMAMAFFFAIAGKEIFESMFLKNGSLNPPSKAITPIFATIGGIVVPVLTYFTLALSFGELESVARGWALPTATDIAFSLLVARLIFGKGHPAIAFLLLVAILDDLIGIIIIALFYPQEELALEMLFLVGIGIAFCLSLKKMKVNNFWPYLILGGIPSWLGFATSGLHPALGLLPIIFFMPHAESDIGIYAREEDNCHDALNAFEHAFKVPIEVILFMFGLCNAGVIFGNIGAATFVVCGGLLIGKPLGIFIFGGLAAQTYGLPNGMSKKDLWVVGCVASIGFTVALFLAGVAFEPGLVQDAAKLGALLSFMGAIVSFLSAEILGVEKRRDASNEASSASAMLKELPQSGATE